MEKIDKKAIEITAEIIADLYLDGDLDDEPRRKNEGLKQARKDIDRLKNTYKKRADIKPIKHYLKIKDICDRKITPKYTSREK